MKWHRLLAWGAWAAFVVVLILAIRAGSHPAQDQPIGLTDMIWAGAFIGFPTAGALIAARFPRSPLGWLLCAAPLLLITGVWTGDQSEVVANTGGSASAAAALVWIAQVTFGIAVGLFALLPLFIPDGKLPSQRWRPVAYAIVLVTVLSTITAMFEPGIMSDSRYENPYGIESARSIFDVVGGIADIASLILLLTTVASITIRFRKASGIERQQLRWLRFGAAVVAFVFLVAPVMEALGVGEGPIASLILVPGLLAIPVTLGIAMLRHRLYDIDVVVNRTLVYGASSAFLGAAYLGVVVVLQQVLAPISSESDLAVAASTLTVAALFRPVRSRIQSFIDKRFYRNKYDAGETLQEFSVQLRDRVDLDSLSLELVQIVGKTMQPAHASLWLRSETP